jgi:hypothetical protein
MLTQNRLMQSASGFNESDKTMGEFYHSTFTLSVSFLRTFHLWAGVFNRHSFAAASSVCTRTSSASYGLARYSPWHLSASLQTEVHADAACTYRTIESCVE